MAAAPTTSTHQEQKWWELPHTPPRISLVKVGTGDQTNNIGREKIRRRRKAFRGWGRRDRRAGLGEEVENQAKGCVNFSGFTWNL